MTTFMVVPIGVALLAAACSGQALMPGVVLPGDVSTIALSGSGSGTLSPFTSYYLPNTQQGWLLDASSVPGATGISLEIDTFSIQDTSGCSASYVDIIYLDKTSCSGNASGTWTFESAGVHLCGDGGTLHDASGAIYSLGGQWNAYALKVMIVMTTGPLSYPGYGFKIQYSVVTTAATTTFPCDYSSYAMPSTAWTPPPTAAPTGPSVSYGLTVPSTPTHTLTGMSGSISHLNYAPNEAVSWLIQVPTGTGFAYPAIQLSFNGTFDIEDPSASYVCFDWVEVLYLLNCPADTTNPYGIWSLGTQVCGRNGVIQGAGIGKTTQRVFTAPETGSVMIEFSSDASNNYGGFQVWWQVVDLGTNPCWASSLSPTPPPTSSQSASSSSSTGCRQLTASELSLLQSVTSTPGVDAGNIAKSSASTADSWWKITTASSGVSGSVTINLLDLGLQSSSPYCLSDQSFQVGYLDSQSRFCPSSTLLCGSTALYGVYYDASGKSYGTSATWSTPGSNIVVHWESTLFTNGLSYTYQFSPLPMYPSGANLITRTGTSMTIDLQNDFGSKPTVWSNGNQVGWLLQAPTLLSKNPTFRLLVNSIDLSTTGPACYNYASTISMYTTKISATQWGGQMLLCGQASTGGQYFYTDSALQIALGDALLSSTQSSSFLVVFTYGLFDAPNTPKGFTATLDIVLPVMRALYPNLNSTLNAPTNTNSTFSMPFTPFQSCSTCSSDTSVWTWNITSALPAYARFAVDTKLSTYSLVVMPPGNVPPNTRTTIVFQACNEFQMCATVNGILNVITLATADATSTLTCTSNTITVVDPKHPPPLQCTFTAQHAGSGVMTSLSALSFSVSGVGFVSPAQGDLSSAYGHLITFTFVTGQTGGRSVIREATTGASFTVQAFKDPDSTMTVSCNPSVLSVNQPTTCTVTPKYSKKAVLMETKPNSPGMHALSISIAALPNYNVIRTLSYPIDTIASSFLLNVTGGFAVSNALLATAIVRTDTGNITSATPAKIFVVSQPDTTSTLQCYPNAQLGTVVTVMPAGGTLTCLVTPMKANVTVPGQSAQFKVQISRGLQRASIGNFTADSAGRSLPITLTAAPAANGTVALDLLVGPLAHRVIWPPVTIAVLPGPFATRLTCDTIINLWADALCTVRTYGRDGAALPVLGASLTVTTNQRLVTIRQFQTVDGNPSKYTLASFFMFSVATQNLTSSASIIVSDGYSKATIYVVNTPDLTSVISCNPTYVSVGQSLSCSITPNYGGLSIYARANSLAVSASRGTLSQVTVSSGDVAGKLFQVSFTSTKPGTTTLLSPGTVTLTLYSNFPPYTTIMTVTVVVIDTPGPASILSCASTTTVAFAPLLCTITPYDLLSKPTYAAATQFLPYIDPDPVSGERATLATISQVQPPASNVLSFYVTPNRAWTTITVRIPIAPASYVTISSTGSAASFSWSNYISGYWPGDPPLTMLARSYTDATVATPTTMNAGASAGASGILQTASLRSMACTWYACSAVTSGGILYTFGDMTKDMMQVYTASSRAQALGRQTSSPTVPGVPSGLSSLAFKAVGAAGNGDWDIVYGVSTVTSYALTVGGALYHWGTAPDGTAVPVPQVVPDSKGLSCGTTPATVTAISGASQGFMFATQCQVFAISSSELLPTGRPGSTSSFRAMSGIAAGDLALGVTKLLMTTWYGVIVLGGTKVYSFGNGLSDTDLPSGDTSVAPYTLPSGLLRAGVTIVDVQGNDYVLLMLTSDGNVHQLSLVVTENEFSPGTVAATPTWQTLSTFGTSADLFVEAISVSPTTTLGSWSYESVALAATANGNLFSWYPSSESPAILSTTSPDLAGMTGRFVYSGEYIKVMSATPTSVLVDASRPDTNAECGVTSLTCGSLVLAVTRFTQVGTVFTLAAGTYNVSQTLAIAADGIQVRSSSSATISCASLSSSSPCMHLSGKSFGMQGVTVRDANSTDGAVYVAQSTYATFTGVTFVANRGDGGGAINADQSSVVVVVRCTFLGNKATGDGGAIIGAPNSKLSVMSSTFQANAAVGNGGAIASDAAEVTIVSTTFTSNTAGASGAAISAISSSDVTATGIVATGNVAGGTGGAISLVESSLTLKSSTLSSNAAGQTGGAVNLELGGLAIQGTTLTGNVAGVSGGAIYCITIDAVTITSSTLTGNSATSTGGGALYATFSSPVITSSTLASNKAPVGGAVFVSINATLTLANTVVRSNNATSSLDGGGGGVSFRQAQGATFSNVQFIGNVAQQRGGAVEFQGTGYSFAFTNVTVSRCAAPSGGGFWYDLQAPPSPGWVFANDNAAKAGPNRASLAKSLAWTVLLPAGYLPDSQVPFARNLQISLLDAYGQVVAVDNSTIVSITAPGGVGVDAAEVTLSQGQYLYSPSSSTIALTLRPNATTTFQAVAFVANVGVLRSPWYPVTFRSCAPGEFINGGLRCSLCEPGMFSLAPMSTECTMCPAGTQKPLRGNSSCTACPPGSYSQMGSPTCHLCDVNNYQPYSGMSSCYPCWPNCYYQKTSNWTGMTSCMCSTGWVQEDNPTYPGTPSNDALNQPYRCVKCPSGGDCSTVIGRSFATVQPLDNYQAEASGLNRSFIACETTGVCGAGMPRGRCLSDPATGYQAYEGNLCTECAPGFGRNGDYGCNKCPDAAQNRAYLSAAFFAYVIFMMVTVQSTMAASAQPKALHSILIKIIMNSIQFNALAVSFKYNWPSSVAGVLQTQRKASSVGTSLISVDCFMTDQTTMRAFYVQCLLFLFLPLMMMIGPIFIIVPYTWFRHFIQRARGAIQYGKDQYITAVVVGLFVIHPNIVEQTLKLFNCVSLASQPGYTYLVADMHERCWSGDHLKYALGVGLPMIILYVVGIPVAAFLVLRKNKAQLDTQRMKMRYGFLSQGYNKEAYYWEIVVMGRKIVISAIAVALVGMDIVQSLSALLLVVICLVWHTYQHPFESKLLDQTEFLSLLNSFTTFMCGQYLFANVTSSSATLITVVIFMSNVIFFGFAIKALVGAVLQMMKDAKSKKVAKTQSNAGEGNGPVVMNNAQAATVVAAAPAQLYVMGPNQQMVPINAAVLANSQESSTPFMQKQPSQVATAEPLMQPRSTTEITYMIPPGSSPQAGT